MWYSNDMPGRNIVKIDMDNTFYHVYARGVNKQTIFAEDADYIFFEWLLKRYLSHDEITNKRGVPYQKFHDTLTLISYCIMPNHFHMLVDQAQAGAMQHLMRGVMSSYSRYFNRKYDRTGHLFENTYRASRINDDKYLLHISRYIHLNPPGWRTYPHSSIGYFLGDRRADWIHPTKVLELFASPVEYLSFTQDYEPTRDELAAVKRELANG
jgi:putative transposase